jgi:ATP-dependent RNA helicase RhlE
VPQDLKSGLLLELLKRGDVKNAIVFTRTKHRANRLAEQLGRQGVPCERIHGNRSQAQRTAALAGFKSGRFSVLVATDIAARGIDVEALSHVINFDVPAVPEDYIHRVGRTARAEATGDAFTFVSRDEEQDLRAIERAIGKTLPRITLPGFDYARKATERFEVPIRERIAEIRARKAEDRARAAANAERRAAHAQGQRPPHAKGHQPRGHQPSAGHGPATAPVGARAGASARTSPAADIPSRADAALPSRSLDPTRDRPALRRPARRARLPSRRRSTSPSLPAGRIPR